MKIQVLGLVLATAIAAPQIARAERSQSIVPPPVPADLELSPDEFTPYLMAHAVGTQGYVCVAVGSAYNWVPFGPQATLFDKAGGQVMTHFLSPAPFDRALSPTWQHSRDTSAVWGRVLKMSSDSNFVAPGAIPWLLLEATVVVDGPRGSDTMTLTRRIQRLNTVEGKAPTTGCAVANDIGKRGLVPYEADYFFYKEKAGRPSSD
jgi:Protein of unknown function (DUF3455)